MSESLRVFRDVSASLSMRIANLRDYFAAPERARFPIAERVSFAKRLSFLLGAGMPLSECIEVIREQTKDASRLRVYGEVADGVMNGRSFAETLSRFPRCFGHFSASVVRVGEASGTLSRNLSYLAEELERQAALRGTIIGALLYPAFVSVATLILTGGIVAYIFPKLAPIFTSLDVPLPITTQILIGVSDYLAHWGLLTLAVIALGIIGFLELRARNEELRLRSDMATLRIPYFGALVRSYWCARVARTLALLLESGASVLRALELATETTEHRAYRRACAELGERVVRGAPISEGLAASPHLFPSALVALVKVGEASGTLPGTLGYLAEHHEADVRERAKRLTSSVEPALMIAMGLLIGLVAVAIITPIYSITGHFSPH